MVCELLEGGDLLENIMKPSDPSERYFSAHAVHTLVKELVETMQYCHQRGIVHRDLKLENIIFVQNPRDSSLHKAKTEATLQRDLDFKIIDFGMGSLYGDAFRDTKLGTPVYMAPEISGPVSYDAKKVDVWAIGVLAYVLLCGVPPFLDAAAQQCSSSDLFKEPIWAQIGHDAKGALVRMLERDPAKRPNCDELLRLPWLTNTPRLVTKHSSSSVINDAFKKSVSQNLARLHKHRQANRQQFLEKVKTQKCWQLSPVMDAAESSNSLPGSGPAAL